MEKNILLNISDTKERQLYDVSTFIKVNLLGSLDKCQTFRKMEVLFLCLFHLLYLSLLHFNLLVATFDKAEWGSISTRLYMTCGQCLNTFWGGSRKSRFVPKPYFRGKLIPKAIKDIFLVRLYHKRFSLGNFCSILEQVSGLA